MNKYLNHKTNLDSTDHAFLLKIDLKDVRPLKSLLPLKQLATIEILSKIWIY